MRKLMCGALAVAAAGCATAPVPTPVTEIEFGDICIIDNPRVRDGFRNAIEKNLLAKGFTPRVTREAELPTCPVALTYTARWVCNIAGCTIVEAELVAYREGKRAGNAGFDAMINPFGYYNAAYEVRVMVQKLFPEAPAPGVAP